MNKKLVSCILIALLIVMQLVPMGVFAGDSDLRAALEELEELKNSEEGETIISEILGKLWDYAADELGDGIEATAESIYDEIKESVDSTDATLWTRFVNEGPSPVAGKLEKSSLIMIINEVLERKEVIKGMYDAFKEAFSPIDSSPELKALVKLKLGLDADASDSDVYVALLNIAGPVIELSDDGEEFARHGDALDILERLDITEEMVEIVLGERFVEDINNTMDIYISRLNGYMVDFGVSKENVIYALKIFGLFYEEEPGVTPSPSPTPTPGTGGPGGGGPGGSDAVPSPTPSTAPEIIDDPDKLAEDLGDALNAIEAETDPARAKDAAKELISNTVDNIKALADQGKSTIKVIETLKDAAKLVLSKVNTRTVTATVSDGMAAAKIDEAVAAELVEKLDEIAAVAAELNDELAKVAPDAKVEVVLTIKAAVDDADAKVSQIELPASLLTAASDKGIDKIAVDTGIATIAIAPDAIAETGEGAISLSAGKVDVSELTEEQKAAVGESVVFEFTAKAGDKDVTTFAKPVEITVPYTLKENENPEYITVFFLNDKGELENVIGKYNADTKTVTFTTTHFSKYVVKENKVTFSDLAAAEWARTYIEAMAAKGVLNGMGDGKFAPSENLTRAQFAAMIVRIFKLEAGDAESVFTDVKPGDWYYSAVVAAYKAGIVNGVSADKFAPNTKVTRQEMATMVARALVNIKGKSLTADEGKYVSLFADKDEISSYAVNGANLVARFGIMNGKPGNVFDPTGNATRAEAAAVIYRMFNID